MKNKLSISMDTELLNWLKSKVLEKRFANLSHGIEYSVRHIKLMGGDPNQKK